MEALRPTLEERLAALGIAPSVLGSSASMSASASASPLSSSLPLPGGGEYRRRAEELRLEAKETELRERLLDCRLQEEKVRAQQEAGLLMHHREEEAARLKRTHAAAILALRKDYETEIAGLRASVAQLQDELQHVTSEKEARLTELRMLAERMHAQVREEVQQKLQTAKALFEEDRAELIQRHTQALESTAASSARRIETQERDHRQQYDSLAQIIADLERHTKELTGEVDRMRQEAKQSEVERLTLSAQLRAAEDRARDTKNTMELLTSRTDESMERMKIEYAQHQRQLEDALYEAQKEVVGAKERSLREREQHDRDLSDLQLLHTEAISALQLTLTQREAEVHEYRRALDRLQEARAEDARKRSEEEREKREEERLVREEDLQILNAQLTRQEAQARTHIVALEAEVEHQRQVVRDTRDEASRLLKHLREQGEREREEIVLRCDEEKLRITEAAHLDTLVLQEKFQKELERLESARRAVIESHAAEARRIEEEHVLVLRAQEELVTKLKRTFEEKSLALREEIAAQRAETDRVREEMARRAAAHETEIARLRLQHEEARATQQRATDQRIHELQGALDRDRIRHQEKHGEEMVLLLEKTTARITQLEEQHALVLAEKDERLRIVLRQLEEEKAHMSSQVSERTAQERFRYDERVTEMEERYTAQTRLLEAQLREERDTVAKLREKLRLVEAEAQWRVTQLQLDFEGRIKGLLPESLRRELEETISALTDQTRALEAKVGVLQEQLAMYEASSL